MIDWSRYPNFSYKELQCSHTGKCYMHEDMLEMLQGIRDEYGKPIFISSGYRDITHPLETTKDRPGEHTFGMAVDITCNGRDTLRLIEIALSHGITRLGVHQKGRASGRFIHIGIGDKLTNEFPSAIWTY